MFASKVADTVAAAATALSSGSGETLTTAGAWVEEPDELSPPAPPHARTAATHTIVVTRPQSFRFKGHLPCGV
jgi:hypothetical protein